MEFFAIFHLILIVTLVVTISNKCKTYFEKQKLFGGFDELYGVVKAFIISGFDEINTT